MSVLADGVSVAVRPQAGDLPVSLLPEAHELTVQWQRCRSGMEHAHPCSGLKIGASNITTRIDFGE